LNQERLRDAGNADQQYVTPSQYGGDQVVDDIELADDASSDLVREPLPCLRELLQQLEVTLIGAVLLA
jgi:hypothetical protein